MKNQSEFEFTWVMHFYHAGHFGLSASSFLKMRIYFFWISYNLVRERRSYPSVMTRIRGYLDSLRFEAILEGRQM